MAGDRVLDRLRSALVAKASGYLHNPVRRELVTCAVCAEPAPLAAKSAIGAASTEAIPASG